jgi:hypothetical protein
MTIHGEHNLLQEEKKFACHEEKQANVAYVCDWSNVEECCSAVEKKKIQLMTSGKEHEWTEAAGPSDRPGGSRDFAATWGQRAKTVASSVLWWYPGSGLATEASRLHDFNRELVREWHKVNIDSSNQQFN